MCDNLFDFENKCVKSHNKTKFLWIEDIEVWPNYTCDPLSYLVRFILSFKFQIWVILFFFLCLSIAAKCKILTILFSSWQKDQNDSNLKVKGPKWN